MFIFDDNSLEYFYQSLKKELDKKVDKEKYIVIPPVGKYGTHAVVDVVTDETRQIAKDDPMLLQALEESGRTIESVYSVTVADKVFSKINYSKEKKQKIKNLGMLLEPGVVLYQQDIANDLNTTDSRKVLSAAQGYVLKNHYLENRINVFITQEEYDALDSGVRDDEHFVYYIIDAEEIYGLTEQQIEYFKTVSDHLFENNDLEYVSNKEIVDARVDNKHVIYGTLSERLNALDDRIEKLSVDIENIENIFNVYGVHINFEEDNITRISQAKDLESNDFDSEFPWAGIKRCTIMNGEVTSYYGDSDYVEDGSMGDVVVEIPKFYYKVVPVRLEDNPNGLGHQMLEGKWFISDNECNGFKVHPAFVVNGIEYDYIYVSAFENSVSDSLPISISGTYPVSGANQSLTLANAYDLCSRKNENSCLLNISTLSALQLLYLIEFADFNCQEKIGLGNVDDLSTSITGSTFSIGNDSGEVNGAVCYRGIENLWGSIRTWIGGINIEVEDTIRAYWSNEETTLNSKNGYKEITFNLASSNGYISRIGYDENNDFLFLPTETIGTSNSGLCDVYTINTIEQEWFNMVHGGMFNNNLEAGLWNIALNNKPTVSLDSIGIRYIFYK